MLMLQMGFMMSQLHNLIKDSFDEMMNEVHVSLPAEIIKYDVDKMTCSVQPLIQRKFYRRSEPSKYPVINNVPVVFSRTASALIRLPVTKGDIVALVFTDHEISNWVQGSGASGVYIENRQHHINDCFAFVGGYPIGKKKTAKNPKALEIVVASGTKLPIGNETDELLAIAHASFTELKTLTEKLSATLTNIQAITVVAGGDTSTPPLNSAAFAATKTQVDAVATAVNTQLSKLSNIKV